MAKASPRVHIVTLGVADLGRARRFYDDASLARAAKAGARLVKPAHEAFWGGYSGTFSDPDGHLWEVAWNPGFAFGPEGGPDLP
jgi:uncharacterized glyoxalase superfamily protein PhnB